MQAEAAARLGRGLRRAVSAALVALALPCLCGGAAAAEKPGPHAGQLAIAYAAGALTLEARDVPLSDLLRAIGEAVGCKVTVLGDLDAVVTESFQGLALEKAVLKLVGDASVVIVHAPADGADDPPSIAAIHVVAAHDGGAAPSVAAPPAASGRADARAPLPAELMKDLRHTHALVRLTAIGMLMRDRSLDGTPVLADLLATDDDSSVRRRAASALGELGGDEAAAALAPGLADGDISVRLQVALSLGKVGGGDASASLAKALSADPDPRVRAAAASALTPWESEAARRALSAATRDEVAQVRDAAAAVLNRWDRQAREGRIRHAAGR